MEARAACRSRAGGGCDRVGSGGAFNCQIAESSARKHNGGCRARCTAKNERAAGIKVVGSSRERGRRGTRRVVNECAAAINPEFVIGVAGQGKRGRGGSPGVDDGAAVLNRDVVVARQAVADFQTTVRTGNGERESVANHQGVGDLAGRGHAGLGGCAA